MASTYTFTGRVQVVDDTISSAYVEFAFGFDFYTTLISGAGYTFTEAISFKNSGSGRQIIAGIYGTPWTGSYSLSTWYDLELELVDSGSSLTANLSVNGTLRYTYTFPNYYRTLHSISAIVADGGFISGYSGSWSWDRDFDDFAYAIDGITWETDDFADGDLTDWPITIDGGLATGESGGVYWATDAGSTDENLRRARSLLLTQPRNAMVRNLRTLELHHAYNDGGTIKVQTFEPGETTPTTTVNVATGQGSLSPALDFDDAGKLVCLLSDGATRYAAANPRLAASWGTWTI